MRNKREEEKKIAILNDNGNNPSSYKNIFLLLPL